MAGQYAKERSELEMDNFQQNFDQAASITDAFKLQDVVSAALAEGLTDIAACKTTCPKMLFGGLLCSVAAACGPQVKASTSRKGRQHTLPLNTYFLMISPPGGGKSNSFRQCIADDEAICGWTRRARSTLSFPLSGSYSL